MKAGEIQQALWRSNDLTDPDVAAVPAAFLAWLLDT